MKHDMTFYGSVTIGERGQVVIPAEAREAHHLKPGNKLLAFKAPMGKGILLATADDFEQHLQRMSEHMNEIRSKIKESN